MSQNEKQQHLTEHQVTIEEVNRVLEIGRLLLSVLTVEEMEELKQLLTKPEEKLGNAGVT